MKQDLRMNATSPDPDNLAADRPDAEQIREWQDADRLASRHALADRSAPHIPPVEPGKLRSEEDAW